MNKKNKIQSLIFSLVMKQLNYVEQYLVIQQIIFGIKSLFFQLKKICSHFFSSVDVQMVDVYIVGVYVIILIIVVMVVMKIFMVFVNK
jgi:hypothetical protein